MYSSKLVFSRLFYLKNGFLWDFLSVALPTIIDLRSNFDTFIPATLRLLQLKQAGQYFTYLNESASLCYSMIIYRVYQHLLLVVIASCYGIRIARFEPGFAKQVIDKGLPLGFENDDGRFDPQLE